MSRKFENSAIGLSQRLALFNPPTIDGATESVQCQIYRPTSVIAKSSPIEFNIPGTSNHYIDLKRTKLYVKVKIVKADKSAVGVDDKVALTNLTIHSLFRQVDVYVQQTLISPGVGTCYPYKSYIDTILKGGDLNSESQIFYRDKTGFMDRVTIENGNTGFVSRWGLTFQGGSTDMVDVMCSDICQQDRLLLNGVPLRFKLFPHADNFALMSDGNEEYSIQIEEAYLKVHQISLNPAVIVAHSESLAKSPALYPMTSSNIKTFNIPAGSFGWEGDDIYHGDIPTRMVVGITTASAFSGNYSKSPFNFGHHNLNFIGLYVDNQSVPAQPLMPNYKNFCFINAYNTLTDEIERTTSPLLVTREDYRSGYALYIFSLKAKENESLTELKRKGHTRLSITFAEAPTEPLTVICYSTFPSVLSIDQSRNVNLV